MWTFFSKKKHGPLPLQRLEQLEFSFHELQHEHSVLAERFQKLSGRYYRRFGKGDEEPATTPQGSLPLGTSKDELRRAAGIVAGRPAPHRGG